MEERTQQALLVAWEFHKKRHPKKSFKMVGVVGLEPTTNWLRVNCATNCATHPYNIQLSCSWCAVGYLVNGSPHSRSDSPTPSSDLTLSQLLGGVLRTHTLFNCCNRCVIYLNISITVSATKLYYHKCFYLKL